MTEVGILSAIERRSVHGLEPLIGCSGSASVFAGVVVLKSPGSI
jgi:hypothetical protein